MPERHFKQCLMLLMSDKSPSKEDLADEEFMRLNSDASDIYVLIH